MNDDDEMGDRVAKALTERLRELGAMGGRKGSPAQTKARQEAAIKAREALAAKRRAKP